MYCRDLKDHNDKTEELRDENRHWNDENKRLREALSEIAKGEGAFSLDPLTHASNTIENMKRIAQEALK